MRRFTCLILYILGALFNTQIENALSAQDAVTDLKPLFSATADRLASFSISQDYVCEKIRGSRFMATLTIRERIESYAARVLGLDVWNQDQGKSAERISFQFLVIHPEMNRFSVTNYQIAPDEVRTGNPPHIANAEVLLFDLDGNLLCRMPIPTRPGRPVVSETRVVAMIAQEDSTDQSLLPIVVAHHEALGIQGRIDDASFIGELLLLDSQGAIRRSLSPTVPWSSCKASPNGHYLAYLDGQSVLVDGKSGLSDFSKLGCVLTDEIGTRLFFQPKYVHVERTRQSDLGNAELAQNWPKETTFDPYALQPIFVDNQGRVLLHGSMSFWIYDSSGKMVHSIPDNVYTGIPYAISKDDVFAFSYNSRKGLVVLDMSRGILLLKNAEIRCPSVHFNPPMHEREIMP